MNFLLNIQALQGVFKALHWIWIVVVMFWCLGWYAWNNLYKLWSMKHIVKPRIQNQTRRKFLQVVGRSWGKGVHVFLDNLVEIAPFPIWVIKGCHIFNYWKWWDNWHRCCAYVHAIDFGSYILPCNVCFWKPPCVSNGEKHLTTSDSGIVATFEQELFQDQMINGLSLQS